MNARDLSLIEESLRYKGLSKLAPGARLAKPLNSKELLKGDTRPSIC